jgi:hypothetical protein
MNDLAERLRQIERNPSPDLWEEIADRAVGSAPGTGTEHGWRRVAIIAASLAIGMAAVAGVVFAFRASPGTTPSTAGWEGGEIESLNATFQYPSTWHLQPFEESLGTAGFTGVVVSNVEEDLHHPDLGANESTSAWDLSGLPPGGVVVSIEYLDAIGVPSSPDSQFPLSLADAEHLHQTPLAGSTEGLWLPFTLDGRHLGARVYFGPEATEVDRRVAAGIVASIRPRHTGEPPADPGILVSSSGPSGDQALLTGRLTIENGCLAVSTGPESSVYVVWPKGYSLGETDGETWLVDDSGNQIARIGDEVQMGGGITNLAHAEPEVVGGIPSSCEVGGPDAYWFAGTPEVVPDATNDWLRRVVLEAGFSIVVDDGDRLVADGDGQERFFISFERVINLEGSALPPFDTIEGTDVFGTSRDGIGQVRWNVDDVGLNLTPGPCVGEAIERPAHRGAPTRSSARAARSSAAATSEGRASSSASRSPTSSVSEITGTPGTSIVARPHTMAAGTPAISHAASTPAGTLPCSDCSSSDPSPVMTRSASAMRCANPTASITTSTPGRRRAPQNASRPNPRPPAAPAPGSSRRSTPRSRCTTAARWPRARSSRATSSGDAPFCGP